MTPESALSEHLGCLDVLNHSSCRTQGSRSLHRGQPLHYLLAIASFIIDKLAQQIREIMQASASTGLCRVKTACDFEKLP